MSLKRILGVMLASRMAGRGRRRGSLGSAALLGGLGGRGLRGKAGVAALGYMAYQAYRDHQSRQRASGSTAHAASSGSGSGLSGIFDQIAGALGGEAQSTETPDPRHQQAAEAMSDDRALLLIRGMIAAAHADGNLSTDERHRIAGQLDEAEASADERRLIATEIENPKPIDTLLARIDDHDTAIEFYLASRAAVDSETEANRAYLTLLRNRLGITEEEAREAEELAP
ncbi:MAG: tellurite resistance TerB family protein [Limimaricola soesokkakensis]|uniref:tellurite resistance TerB family protein n=1 Tax=Limimaricola soesokkakensis TaxID=1343159 RepID=UPI0040598C9F